jgi:hypothetical protein
MKRIQRKRTKGYRMPRNAVYVGRPTRWGNPFVLVDEKDRKAVLRRYEKWLKKMLKKDPHFLDPLKGKDLACFCSLDKECHADILLRFLQRV